MSTGFSYTPEKEKMQEWLWIPAIQDLAKSVTPPLRILCLPGRECRFLLKLITKGFTDLSCVTCIEYNKVEALLIRGVLAKHAGSGRVIIDIVMMSVYDYLTTEDRAVEKKYHVIDLDPYGRLADERSDLLNSVVAAVDVQSRANMKEWLLLIQTEVASARGAKLVESLAQAEKAMMEAAGSHLGRHMNAEALSDPSPHAQLLRYSACVAACIAENAYPRFEATLWDRPMFYRGSDDYGVPSQRALMGAFAFRLSRVSKAVAARGSFHLIAQRQPLVDECIRKSLKAKAVVASADGGVKSFGQLSAISYV